MLNAMKQTVLEYMYSIKSYSQLKSECDITSRSDVISEASFCVQHRATLSLATPLGDDDCDGIQKIGKFMLKKLLVLEIMEE